jgi:hypothetical protein
LNVAWYILLSIATIAVMWYYSEKNLPWHIRISVFIALGASLSIVIMVPWDVSNVYHQRCQNKTHTELIDGKEPTCPVESTTLTKVRCSYSSVALVLIFTICSGVARPDFKFSESILERCVLGDECTRMVFTPGAASIQ